MSEIIFVSGIDTDAGKSYATAALAMRYAAEGKSVITMKFIQTGCRDESEDIVAHRRLMGCEMLPCDIDRTTAPIILSYPASAQLAAKIDGVDIDLSIIDRAVEKLAAQFDVVLIEGAGGLMVPITDDFFAIDYARTRQLPIALVTNSKLGSINHTVLSLEAIGSRSMKLCALLYNHHFDSDPIISADTHAFIRRYTERRFPECEFIDIKSFE